MSSRRLMITPVPRTTPDIDDNSTTWEMNCDARHAQTRVQNSRVIVGCPGFWRADAQCVWLARGLLSAAVHRRVCTICVPMPNGKSLSISLAPQTMMRLKSASAARG